MGNISMQIVTQELISGKKILLRYDIDVALSPLEDFKLKAGSETLKLCLRYGSKVILMGHIGRPSFAAHPSVGGEATAGKPDNFFVPKYSVAPIIEWFKSQGFGDDLGSGKLTILENLRFDSREEASDLEFAKELAQKGDVYINEAFSAHRPSASTTVLPTLLPHAAGLHFAEEVSKLTEVRENPKKPFIAIMGGAKVVDKLPVISALSKNADAVLVGGKLIEEIRKHEGDPSLVTQDDNLRLDGLRKLSNVMVGKLNEDGFDIASETVESWKSLIAGAKMIVWNGPLGKFEDPKYSQTGEVIKMILSSNAEIIIGGGDSVAALSQAGLLEEAEQKSFVSVGGGAMLKFLADGTLPTIEALT